MITCTWRELLTVLTLEIGPIWAGIFAGWAIQPVWGLTIGMVLGAGVSVYAVWAYYARKYRKI